MERTTQLLTNLRRVMRLYDAMLRPICRRHQLTVMEANIISFLHNNPGRDTAADIVELRTLPKSNVSQAVDSLAEKGLLLRRQDSRDRRRLHLALTPAAGPITRDVDEARARFRRQLFHNFSPEERECFFQLNQRLADNAETQREE